MRVLVLGSAGYIGSALVPHLRTIGHEVTTFDIADGQDVRDALALSTAMFGQDTVFHLASISSDTACQQFELLAGSVNVGAFEDVVIAARIMGVTRFIFMSSAAVYGSTDEPATEDFPRLPTTTYALHKGTAEVLLSKHRDELTTVVLRSAAVCGVSPKMRFDTTVNMMTNHAVRKRVITVHGGKQRRPSLHIDDMLDACALMLEAPAEKIAGQAFNLGRQNFEVEGIAYMIQCVLEWAGINVPEIVYTPATDDRSYQIDSSKVFNVLRFRPKRGIEQAIKDMCEEFKKGAWPDSLDAKYMNVEQWGRLR